MTEQISKARDGANSQTLKFCRACGCTHPTTDFYGDRSRYDGLTRYCKKQDSARRAERARRSRAKAWAVKTSKEQQNAKK